MTYEAGTVALHAQREKLPNVVIIVADDLGYNDLSGGVGAQTPNIDSLRASGVQFTEAYSAHATCSPARAGLLTGRYPNRFGYESLAVPVSLSWTVSVPSTENARQPVFHYELVSKVPDIGDMNIPTSEVMMSDVLKASNYSTVYIGKWHLGKRRGMTPEDHFDEVLGFLGGASMYVYPADSPNVVNGYLDDPLDRYLWANLKDYVQHNGTTKFPPNMYMTDYLGKQAASAIKTKLAAPTAPGVTVPPLFMVVAFNAPHTPLQATKEDFESPELSHITSHNERVYAAMIKALDRSVGYITDAIREVGQQDNTIVVFTSDNGGPGYVGIQDMNKPLRGWKATFFEGGIRVPLFLSWPARLPAGMTYRFPVSHCDIFTTVTSAASVDISHLHATRILDGHDLMPFLHQTLQENQCEPDDDRCPYRLTTGPHKELFWRTGTYCAYRYNNWKMQVSYRPDSVWLFDMDTDIGEKYNLLAGLPWSEFRGILESQDGDITSCCANLTLLVKSRSLELGSDVITTACDVGKNLLEANSQQADPLWPALTEVPMPVDRARAGVRTLEEEYVYWFL
jgi:arylsulfatase A-like enzyme